jgi:hypothetical protein
MCGAVGLSAQGPERLSALAPLNGCQVTVGAAGDLLEDCGSGHSPMVS